MTKSIVPNKDVFQYAIRYLPTGKYLKKTPGRLFFETDIPSVYNSPKVAMSSLTNESKWGRFKPEDCEIVKFRLIMEEVKEPTKEELEFQKELKNLEIARKSVGEVHWEEITSERGKWEIFNLINHLDKPAISFGDSLHCHEQVYENFQGKFQLIWSHDQPKDGLPMSISRGIDYNWDDKIQELKLKYGIS